MAGTVGTLRILSASSWGWFIGELAEQASVATVADPGWNLGRGRWGMRRPTLDRDRPSPIDWGRLDSRWLGLKCYQDAAIGVREDLSERCGGGAASASCGWQEARNVIDGDDASGGCGPCFESVFGLHCRGRCSARVLSNDLGGRIVVMGATTAYCPSPLSSEHEQSGSYSYCIGAW